MFSQVQLSASLQASVQAVVAPEGEHEVPCKV